MNMNVFDLLLSIGTKSASKPMLLGQNVHKGSFESLLDLFSQERSSLLERKPTDSHVGQLQKESKLSSTFLDQSAQTKLKQSTRTNLDQSVQTKHSPSATAPTKQQRGLVEVTKEADTLHIQTKALEEGVVQKRGAFALSSQRRSIKRDDQAPEPLKSEAPKPSLPIERHFDAKTLRDPKIALQKHRERRSNERIVVRSISSPSIDKVAKEALSMDHSKVVHVKKKDLSHKPQPQTAPTNSREHLSPFATPHELMQGLNTNSKERRFEKSSIYRKIPRGFTSATGPQDMKSKGRIERQRKTDPSFLAKSDGVTRAAIEREKPGHIDLTHTRKSGIDEVGVKKYPFADPLSDTAASYKSDETAAHSPLTNAKSDFVNLHENQKRPLTRNIAGSATSSAKKSIEAAASDTRGPLEPLKGDERIHEALLPHHNSTIVAASHHLAPHVKKSLHAKRSDEKVTTHKKPIQIDLKAEKDEIHEWVKPIAEHHQKEVPHSTPDPASPSMTKESQQISHQQSQDHSTETGESHTTQPDDSPALQTQEHFQELVALQQRHRSLTLHIDQTRVSVSMHNSQLHLRFISSSIFDTEGAQEYVDEVMREHGFEEYRVKIKDRKSEFTMTSLTVRERSRASMIDVKV